MPRITSTTHGESHLRLLRVVRRGDRHDPKDLTVSCRLETAAEASLEEAAGAVVPGEALKNLVHATEKASGEIEPFALAVCERLLETFRQVTRVRVDVAEQVWRRLEIGGKAQGQAFEAGGAERRTTAVTSNGRQIAVVSGIADLMLLRTAGLRAPSPPRQHDDPTGLEDGVQRLLAGALEARWTYSSPDVTFGPYRQGVRHVIVETFAAHARHSVRHTLASIADVALASFPEILDITLAMHERPFRPVDLFSAGVVNPDDLFLVLDEPLGTVEITVERS
jgi:urate oxidase